MQQSRKNERSPYEYHTNEQRLSIDFHTLEEGLMRKYARKGCGCEQGDGIERFCLHTNDTDGNGM